MVPSETQKNSFKNIFENEVTEPELDDDSPRMSVLWNREEFTTQNVKSIGLIANFNECRLFSNEIIYR